MFRRKKVSPEVIAAQDAISDRSEKAGGQADTEGKRGSTMSTIKPNSPNFVPELPRRSLDIPGAGRRGDGAVRSNVSDSRRLTVGREIVLSGDITACEVLVVEGRVDAKLKNCQAIEITPSGVFKGEAEIEEADISGSFDGALTVRGRLTVRNGGRIQGSVRYGQLEVEAGGEINGDVRSGAPAKADAKGEIKTEEKPTAAS
jgi:cytoskeletal protein CcmA (bactofilin family)